MAELPPLPEARIESYQIDAVMRRTTLHTYSASDMRAYAEEAVKQERERIAKEWEHRHGFDKHGVAAAIRARSSMESK